MAGRNGEFAVIHKVRSGGSQRLIFQIGHVNAGIDGRIDGDNDKWLLIKGVQSVLGEGHMVLKQQCDTASARDHIKNGFQIVAGKEDVR